MRTTTSSELDDLLKIVVIFQDIVENYDIKLGWMTC